MLVRDLEYSIPPGTENDELRLTPAITLRPRDPVQLVIRPAT